VEWPWCTTVNQNIRTGEYDFIMAPEGETRIPSREFTARITIVESSRLVLGVKGSEGSAETAGASTRKMEAARKEPLGGYAFKNAHEVSFR